MTPLKTTLVITVAAAVLTVTACAAQPTATTTAPAPATSNQTTAPGGSSAPTGTAAAGDVATGQMIFEQGKTPSGPVSFSGGSNAVSNGACANCHGADAQGKIGPMISWGMLTNGQKMAMMPKYVYKTPEQVYTAVTTGVRPDGTRLKPTMPRYQLTAQHFADIVAFLKSKN